MDLRRIEDMADEDSSRIWWKDKIKNVL